MLTLSHRNNLRRLANHLAALPDDYDHFDMAWFAWDDLEDDTIAIGQFRPALLCRCKTTACAIGHGPSAGIEIDPDQDINWMAYSARVFGLHTDTHATPAQSRSWLYLFSERWSGVDNRPQSAALRILHFLESGVPSDFVGID